MIELGQCEIAGVFGPVASGKTNLIEKGWLPSQTRYVRFDATGESLNDTTVEHIWKSPKQLYERIEKNPYYFRIAYHPGTAIEEDFYWCCRVLWRFDVYKVLVCDEFHEVCSVNETPRFVQTVMRYARHAHLAIIGASQRIADVHKLFTSSCRTVVIFYTQEARDLGAVRDRWGSECEKMVANCRPLLYDDRTKTVRQVPQCVVINKGSSPKLYDFKTQGYVTGSKGSSLDSEDDSDLQRDGIDNHPSTGGERKNLLPTDETGTSPDNQER